MVDFNSEGAFSANKAHILELVILGRRDEVINTFQMWRESKIAGDSREEKLKYKLRGVLFALLLELHEPIKRKLSKIKLETGVDGKKTSTAMTEVFDKLQEAIFSTGDIDDKVLLDNYLLLNKSLDEMNLIKIDNKRKYDSTFIENENDEKGL